MPKARASQSLARPPGDPPGLDPRIIKARKIMKARAIALHHGGMTILEVCAACGICEDTLMMWRREEGMVRPHAQKGQSRLLEYVDELRRAWFSEETLDVISRRYGTSASRVSTFAKEQGWPQRKPRPAFARLPVKVTHLHLDKIRKLWDDGVAALEIGRQIGVSGTAIREVAKRHGWPPRIPPGLAKEELVYQGRLAGMSGRAIARTFSLTRSSVQRVLREGRLPAEG